MRLRSWPCLRRRGPSRDGTTSLNGTRPQLRTEAVDSLGQSSPFLVVMVEQITLALGADEICAADADKSDSFSLDTLRLQQSLGDFIQHHSVLGGPRQSLAPRQRREICVAQLQLHRARGKLLATQACANILCL